MNKLIRPMTLALIVAIGALVLAGCGSSTKESQADKAAQQAQAELKNPPKVTDVATPTVKAVVVKPSAGETDITKKPVIPKQTGTAPTSLVAQDLIVGKGATAKAGDQVSMQYVGELYSNGKEFDSSWKRNKAFDFALGGGQVIPGWDQGIVGMKVGGRRRLIIPADLAYGAQGQPPTIPANAALVFDVDLKKVTAGQAVGAVVGAEPTGSAPTVAVVHSVSSRMLRAGARPRCGADARRRGGSGCRRLVRIGRRRPARRSGRGRRARPHRRRLGQQARNLVLTVDARRRIAPEQLSSAGGGELCATFTPAVGAARRLCLTRVGAAWRLRAGARTIVGSVGQPTPARLAIRFEPGGAGADRGAGSAGASTRGRRPAAAQPRRTRPPTAARPRTMSAQERRHPHRRPPARARTASPTAAASPGGSGGPSSPAARRRATRRCGPVRRAARSP